MNYLREGLHHLAQGVPCSQEEFGNQHGDGDGGLLQQHDHCGVADVVHGEDAHDSSDAVQEPHHGEFMLRYGPLLWRDGRSGRSMRQPYRIRDI